MFDAYQQRQLARPWRRYAIVGVVAAAAALVTVKLVRHHDEVSDRERAEESRREREALDAPHLVKAEGFSFEAPGRVEQRGGAYSAGNVQGGGRSTGFGATWTHDKTAGDPAHRADAVDRLRQVLEQRSQRTFEVGPERPITLAGKPGYATTLQMRGERYYAEVTITDCEGRLVALWIDRESSVTDENTAMLASYRCGE